MMTAKSAFQKFGDKVSDKLKDDAKEHPQTQHEFIHAVFPNDNIMFGKRTSTNKEFRSIYMESKGGDRGNVGHIVRDSGFDVNPYAVWRFRKNSDEVYGRSPAADALTEVFGLNQMSKTLLDAAHLSVRPAKNVPVEMRGRVRTNPDGNNYFDDPKRVISVINSGINYPIGAAERQELRDSMNDKFRVEFFKAFIGRQGEATATEILAIKGEQAGLMISQVDRLYIEGLRRVFNIQSEILDRQGAFSEEAGMPPVPREITESGGIINFLLTGPLAQAQRRIRELQPIQESLDVLAPMASILGPEVLDIINKDELSEIVMEAGSFPQAALNSKDQRKAIRDARAAEQARLQAQQLALEAAKVAPGLAKGAEPNSIQEGIREAVGV
jgi:hypothetical protein